MRTFLISVLLLIVSAAPNLLADPPLVDHSDPGSVARVFYAELRRLGVSGLPGEDDWSLLKGFCSVSLGTALDRAVKEQAAFIRRYPDEKPPWIEGDLFSSLFEGPKQFQVGRAKIDGVMAEVPVDCSHTEGDDTVKWTDALLLVKEGGKWLIDDVRYGGTWDFANSGTLMEALEPEEEE